MPQTIKYLAYLKIKTLSVLTWLRAVLEVASKSKGPTKGSKA